MNYSNRTYYKRNKGFSGSLLEWFSKCVENDDVFRIWYKDGGEDQTCSYVHIISIAELADGDYILGLVDFDTEEGKELITYERLSALSSFALVVNEEDYE